MDLDEARLALDVPQIGGDRWAHYEAVRTLQLITVALIEEVEAWRRGPSGEEGTAR